MKLDPDNTNRDETARSSTPGDSSAQQLVSPDVSRVSYAASGAVAGAVAGAIAGLLGTAILAAIWGALHEMYPSIVWFGLIPGVIGGGIVGAAYGHIVGSHVPRRLVPVAIGAVAATLGALLVISPMAQLRTPSGVLWLLILGAIYGAAPGAIGGLAWWWLWRRSSSAT